MLCVSCVWAHKREERHFLRHVTATTCALAHTPECIESHIGQDSLPVSHVASTDCHTPLPRSWDVCIVHFPCHLDFTFSFGAGIRSFVCLGRKLSFYTPLGQVDCSKLEELAHDHQKVRGHPAAAHCCTAGTPASSFNMASGRQPCFIKTCALCVLMD